jgi:glutathione S-transferase
MVSLFGGFKASTAETRGDSVYVLFGGDYTRASLVQWLLEEAGVPYEFRRLDILQGEHRTAEYLSLNPAGLVPILITPEGDVLYEVAALMLYLTDRHGLGDLAPQLSDLDRGAFLAAVLHIAGEIQPEMKRYHFPHRYSLEQEDALRTQEHAKMSVLSRLGVMNERLSRKGPYLLGKRFSFADFYLCFWIAYLDHSLVCERYPLLGRLYDLLRSRPRTRDYLEETERAAAAYLAMLKEKGDTIIK